MIEFRKKHNGTLEIKCSSEFEHLDAIVDRAQEFLDARIGDEELVYKVVLLLSEAATNAIEHGNKLNASKVVRITLAIDTQRITVTVEDEGDGFDKEQIDNPIDTDNLLNDGGRGLFFIQEMADEYHIEDKGRKIHILFNR